MGGSTVKKEWFFDRVCGEQIVVYAEDGKLVELEGENEQSGAVLGNIYKGKVAQRGARHAGGVHQLRHGAQLLSPARRGRGALCKLRRLFF